jgi:hypothetical protein
LSKIVVIESCESSRIAAFTSLEAFRKWWTSKGYTFSHFKTVGLFKTFFSYMIINEEEDESYDVKFIDIME